MYAPQRTGFVYLLSSFPCCFEHDGVLEGLTRVERRIASCSVLHDVCGSLVGAGENAFLDVGK